jgi:sec-independent protein translocase protein TatC
MARKPIEEYPDPDDMFADTRMTFGEHIEDLRTHLMRALKGLVVGFVIALIIGKYVVEIITEPVKTQLLAYNDRQLERARDKIFEERKISPFKSRPFVLDVKVEPRFLPESQRVKPSPLKPLLAAYARILRDLGLDQASDEFWRLEDQDWTPMRLRVSDPEQLAIEITKKSLLIRPPGLTTLSIQEAFMVFFKVALMTSLVISSPWVFYQIWSFVAAGLYPHEKRLVNVYLPVSLGLFLGGVFICQFAVLPKAIEALLWFNEWLGVQPDLRLNEWLGFAIFMPLVFGLSFQTPMVMLFTYKIGVFNIEAFRQKRRMAWFIMAVFAAVITPSTDAFSMLFLWVPMSLLYELGIFLCWMQPKSAWEMEEESESQELIEV